MLSKIASVLKHSPAFFGRRSLHSKLLTSIPEGASLTRLTNDIAEGESLQAYLDRSWNDFTNRLKPDHFCIYVARASLKNGQLVAGHVASCLTDDSEKPNIIADSCMSLRNGATVAGKKLQYILEHDPNPIKVLRQTNVFTIRFLEFRQELEDHFFGSAKAGDSSERFFFEIPVALLPATPEVFIKAVREFKEKYSEDNYILCDGDVVESDGWKQFTEALNCVVAFYGAVGVRGQEKNPSPQMAVSSYLKWLLGVIKRNNLIEGTGFRSANERTHDDELTAKNPFDISKRKFSSKVSKGAGYFQSPHYDGFTLSDKLTTANLLLNASPPIRDDPQVAYYAGLCYFASREHDGDAAYAFELAAKLSSIYAPLAYEKLSEISKSAHQKAEYKLRAEQAMLELKKDPVLFQEYQTVLNELECLDEAKADRRGLALLAK